jgi:putative hydrolase of the HAD superfamily
VATRYKAIFFDVGETLVYPHPSPAEIMAQVGREMGYPVEAAQIEQAEAAIGPRVLARQAAGGELYSISKENSRRFWTWVYGELLGELEAPPALRSDLALRFHERFNTIETWRLFPDSVPALEAIQSHRQRGLVVGIISNWEDWLETLLVELAIDRYFDFAIISAGVQLEKPDPAIFHTALDRAGVRANEALHVGDSLHADVGGARRVGITPILIDRRGRYSSSRMDDAIVTRSLAEVPPLLERE